MGASNRRTGEPGGKTLRDRIRYQTFTFGTRRFSTVRMCSGHGLPCSIVRFLKGPKQAISYCGLCGAEKSSADKVMRTPVSKHRNKYIQLLSVPAHLESFLGSSSLAASKSSSLWLPTSPYAEMNIQKAEGKLIMECINNG